QVPGQWPTPDQVPTMQPQWASLINPSSVPNAPVQTKAAGDCSQTSTYCNWSCNHCQRPNDVIICPAQKDWGLTYDDGPSIYTPALLDYLKLNNIKATFFVIGSRVLERPDVLRRTIAEGHQLGIHTWSHPYLTTLTNNQIIAELKWTETIIKTVAGVTPIYMRPPYGDVDDRVRSIATQMGYKVVIWDVDTTDWLSNGNPTYNPNTITNIVQNYANQKSSTGHISLEHDLFPVAAAAAPKALDIILQAGFAAKPVGTCVGTKFYVEDGGSITTAQSSISSVTPNGVTTSNTNATGTSVDVPSATNSSQISNASHCLSSFALFVVSAFCIMFLGPII
ncbi:8705_t:CDS:2, partial [Paraglomus occultum]